MDKPAPVLVGVITSAHGVKGQVKIKFFSDSVDALLKQGEFFDVRRRKFTLTKAGVKDSLIIAGIQGVGDRNAAEQLKGTELYAPAIARKIKKNQWLPKDLIGLEARLKSGRNYGKVIELYNFGAGDILEIQLPDSTAEMLPFSSRFVGDIFPDQGYLVVMPPDYMEPGTEEEQP